MIKKLFFALSLLACAMLLFGCGGAKTKKVKVVLVTNNMSDFWKIVEAGARDAAKDFDVDVDVLLPTQGTFAEQKRILEDVAVSGVDGLSVSPVNPEKTEILDKLAAQTTLICMDSDSPNSKRVCYVGTKNIEAGKLAGEQIKKALPDGGKIMVFVGTMDAQNAADRYKGIEEVLKGTNITIAGVMTDNTDRTKARQNVEDTLIKHKDVSCLVGLWSYNGPAICRAVENANMQGKVKVVCFDEDQTTLDGVKSGTIFATIVQQPYKFGYESVKLLKQIADGDKSGIPADKIIDTGAVVVDKANVDAFSADLKAKIGGGDKDKAETK
ncbi:MAG: sugar-binding protein [Abditibacteriota bacterium]|nr:sugar-binding protein [Abditibacteriota bacterium]